VGVAQHHRIERGGVERERLGVARLGVAAALDQPAIQQDPLASGLDQVHRTSDLACRAMEMHLHGNLLAWTPSMAAGAPAGMTFDTPAPAGTGVESPPRPRPGGSFFPMPSAGQE